MPKTEEQKLQKLEWLRSRQTQECLVEMKEKKKQAWEALLGACLASSDPTVRGFVRSYMTLGDVIKELGGK